MSRGINVGFLSLEREGKGLERDLVFLSVFYNYYVEVRRVLG